VSAAAPGLAPPAAALAIPARLDASLVALVALGWAGLLLLAARVESGWALAAVTAAFALLFQTNFALFHEASHLKLHPRPRWNRALGWVCGALFGMSCAMDGRL
jgi:fatty acid desaturase